MLIQRLSPTENFAHITDADCRVWTGLTERGSVVHVYVVAVAVPVTACPHEDLEKLTEIFPSDPMLVTSEQLGFESTEFVG